MITNYNDGSSIVSGSAEFDPITLISIGGALAPVIEKYISMFSGRMRIPAYIDDGADKYGYCENYDPDSNTWTLGYKNKQDEYLIAHYTVEHSIRAARKSFKDKIFPKK